MAGSHSRLLTLLTLLALAATSLAGQGSPNPTEMSDRALNSQVVDLVNEGEFLQARPFLQEMQQRLSENGEIDQERLEPIKFFLASSFLQEYQQTDNKDALQKAVASFREYVSTFPRGPRRTLALLNLGDAYTDLGEYDQAITAYTTIYEDRTASGAVRTDIRRMIARTYLRTDQPERGLPYFLEAYERAVLNEEARAEAATWLLQAYLSQGELNEIRPYFRHLTGQRAALFNPQFNVSLIRAGDELFERGNYDFAILFYEIVKEKEDIVAFYESAVERLRSALEFREEGTEEAIQLEQRFREAEANLRAVKEMRDYDADVRWRSARVLLESQRTWEALWSFYNLMLEYPEHEQAEDFLFLAFTQARQVNDSHMLVQLANDYLDRSEYQRFRGQVTLDLATYYQEQDMEDKFFELAVNYLESAEQAQNEVAGQLASLVSIHLLERDRVDEIHERMSRYNRALGELPAAREATQYWSSLALVVAGDYQRGLDSFNDFIDTYGTSSRFSEDAHYRRALSIFGLNRPDEAYEQFVAFVEQFPAGTRRGEAELYMGDIQRGKGQLAEALTHYQLVEENTDRLSFITRAVFAISELHVEKGDNEAAAAVIRAYVDRHGDAAELSEAYLRLGNFAQQLGRVADRFRDNIRGLENTANDPSRYAVDETLINYVRDYPKFVQHYRAAIELIDAMLADSAYRDKIVNDRTAQHQFFQSEAGSKVDPALATKIVRDRDFRRTLAESPQAVLRELRSDYADRLESLQPYSLDSLFARLRANASDPKTVLEMRIAMAQEKMTGEDQLAAFTIDQIKQASPAVMLWRAQSLKSSDPAQASELLEFSMQHHPRSPIIYETLLSKAEIAMERARAEPNTGNWEAALAQFNQVIERFGGRAEDGAPFLAKGEILIQLGREDEALDILSNILRNPQWRGRPHAKAHLQLGLAHYSLGNYGQAHGFFERLMLGFGGFREEVALAYYWDLKTLESMNETESVNQLLAEIRTRSDLEGTEGYRLIKENYAL